MDQMNVENKQRLYVLGIFLMVIYPVNTQIIGAGSCPDVEVVKNFDLSSYLHGWYEYARYPNVFETGATCVKANYYFKNNFVENPTNENSGHKNDQSYPVVVENSAIREILFSKNNIKMAGKARLEDPSSDEAKLIVNIAGRDGNYWVLDTDYRTYSIVWSCTEMFFFNIKFLWILTGSRIPNEDVIQRVDRELKRQSISTYFLSKTKQQSCNN